MTDPSSRRKADAGLRVAVVGLGYFSQFHLRAWRRIAGVRIAGVVDPDPQRRSAADAGGAPVHADLDELLAHADPDVIDVVTPPTTHAALIRRALAPGRMIVCQKPVCGTFALAQTVADEAERAGAVVAVHENFRFQPWHRALKRLMDEGRLGAPLQCTFRLRPGDGRGADAYLARQPAFRTMPQLLIHETGIHFIDLFRFLFGEIDTVYADLRRLNAAIAGEDAGHLLLTHRSGMRALFDGNRLADHATDDPRRTMGEMLVEGEVASVRLDGYGRLFLRRFGDQREELAFAGTDDPEFGGGCVEALNRHVIDHLSGRGPLENELRSYLPVMRASEAAYRSAAEGRRVHLEEVP